MSIQGRLSEAVNTAAVIATSSVDVTINRPDLVSVTVKLVFLFRKSRSSKSIPINATTTEQSPRPQIKLAVYFGIDIFHAVVRFCL
jgi:predicted RNA-binding protein